MNLHPQSSSGYAMVTLHSPTPPTTPPQKNLLGARVHAIASSFNAPALNDGKRNGRPDGVNGRISSKLQDLEASQRR